MSDYVGIIDQSAGAWGVRIPDLPGCYGAGDSADAAIRDARPPPGNGSRIRKDWETYARKLDG